MFCDGELIQKIDTLLRSKDHAVIAIDGRCAAGKTTLAAKIGEHYNAAVIHMDDFFLRPEQRTPERYAQPGGNVDRERFLQEVLHPLCEGRSVLYRPFDCMAQRFSKPVTVPTTTLTVVEGSYSCHPELWDSYDLHIFLSVDSQTQMQRILQREGAERAETFRKQWIPLEEMYFSAFHPERRAEVYRRMDRGIE